jgi:hypothetical protein
LFPECRSRLASAEDTESAVVELSLLLEEFAALGTGLKVELNFLGGPGVQFGTEVGQD